MAYRSLAVPNTLGDEFERKLQYIFLKVLKCHTLTFLSFGYSLLKLRNFLHKIFKTKTLIFFQLQNVFLFGLLESTLVYFNLNKYITRLFQDSALD